MERDAEPRAALLERRPLRGTDAGDERGPRSETRRGRGRVERGAAEPPRRLPFELVACDVTDREEVRAHHSDIEEHVDHIAVLDRVGLAFGAHDPLLLRVRL